MAVVVAGVSGDRVVRRATVGKGVRVGEGGVIAGGLVVVVVLVVVVLVVVLVILVLVVVATPCVGAPGIASVGVVPLVGEGAKLGSQSARAADVPFATAAKLNEPAMDDTLPCGAAEKTATPKSTRKMMIRRNEQQQQKMPEPLPFAACGGGSGGSGVPAAGNGSSCHRRGSTDGTAYCGGAGCRSGMSSVAGGPVRRTRRAAPLGTMPKPDPPRPPR